MDKEKEAEIRRSVDAAFAKKQAPQTPQKVALHEASQVKHVIGVVSGKGGVGKSLVCGGLAVQFARQGYRVGILDADVTGPSIPRMFGMAHERARAIDNLLEPCVSPLGIRVMSTNLVLAEETDPVLWRGPVVGNAIRQFWGDCNWGDLDYLFVDMPPGTGDVALTVFQSLPLDGVVIVSTPQDLVQMVVGKAVKMAQMMQVPIFGLVENMSYVSCPDCDCKIEVLGPSTLESTARTYEIDALDKLPLMPEVVRAADQGFFENFFPETSLAQAVEIIENASTLHDALHNAE